MGKLDEMRKAGGAAAAESIGVGVPPIGGLSAAAAEPSSPRWDRLGKMKNAALIPADRIGVDPDQPREEFDPAALERLAESLKTRGQLQPIRVRWEEGRGVYVIVMGERRWRAGVMAGLPALACVIHEGPVQPGELLALQLVENMLREDLKPIEQARAFRALMDRHGWSTHRVAVELAVSQNHVVTALQLLKLPEAVQARVESGDVPPSTAYELSKIPDPAEQTRLAGEAAAGRLKRDELRARASRGKAKAGGRKPTSRVFRTAAGPKLTAEFKRGLTPETLHAALVEAAASVAAEMGDRTQAAA
jgi:ParB family transcriptional regulator, chromosome partitioning protein